MCHAKKPRSGRATLIFFVVGVGLVLGYFLWPFSGANVSVEEQWATQAWAKLRAGETVAGPTTADGSVPGLIATHVPIDVFGVSSREILLCRSLSLASGSSIDLRFAQSAQADIVFDRADEHPYVLPVLRDLTAAETLENSETATSTTAQERGGEEKRRIFAFLASTPCGLTWPIAELASDSFLRHLEITLFPPVLKPSMSEEDTARLLGPLYRLDRLPKVPGEELPPEAILLPSAVADFPRARGLVLRGLKVTPSPLIDWTREFKKQVAAVPALAVYADIWERRQQTISTWVPQLSDDVGTLLGSGYIRWNRPEILLATATHLFPMDELHLLRAFHANGIESGPYAWYPRLEASGPATDSSLVSAPVPPSVVWVEQWGQRVALAAELAGRLASEPRFCSPIYRVASGELALGDIGNTETVIIYVQAGDVHLRGNKAGSPLILVAESGNILVDCPQVNAHLIALDGEGQGAGGRITFAQSAVLTGSLRAQHLAVSTAGATIRFAPRNFPVAATLPLIFRRRDH